MRKYKALEAEIAVRGIQKKSIAAHLGISARTLSYKLSSGKFSDAEKIAIAQMLDCPADYLFSEAIEMHHDDSASKCISIPVYICGKLTETITILKQ